MEGGVPLPPELMPYKSLVDDDDLAAAQAACPKLSLAICWGPPRPGVQLMTSFLPRAGGKPARAGARGQLHLQQLEFSIGSSAHVEQSGWSSAAPALNLQLLISTGSLIRVNTPPPCSTVQQ